MRRIILFKTGEESVSLRPGSTTYHRVTDSYPISPMGTQQVCWVLEFDDGDVADPATDPLVIGAIGPPDYVGYGHDPEVRVVWRDEIWKPASDAQQSTLLALAEATRPKSTE